MYIRRHSGIVAYAYGVVNINIFSGLLEFCCNFAAFVFSCVKTGQKCCKRLCRLAVDYAVCICYYLGLIFSVLYNNSFYSSVFCNINLYKISVGFVIFCRLAAVGSVPKLTAVTVFGRIKYRYRIGACELRTFRRKYRCVRLYDIDKFITHADIVGCLCTEFCITFNVHCFAVIICPINTVII